MFSGQLSFPITRKFAAGLIAACAMFVMLGDVAKADIFQFNVDAIYDSTANDDPPFTSPDGVLNYRFLLDQNDVFDLDPDGVFAEFVDVSVSYTLDGVQTNHTANVFLENPLGDFSSLSISDIEGRQLNLILPPIELFELLEGVFSINTSQTDFTEGFLGSDANNRFRGTLTVSAVPEPSCAFVSFLGLAAVSVRRRRRTRS